MPTRGVIFDLYGTLIDDAPPADYDRFLVETARAIGADPEGFRVAWEANDVPRYTGPIEACFASICTGLGIADYRPALDLRLGMISNASSELSALWAESVLAPLFDAAFFSADEGMMKPDRRLYERMADALGVAPVDCLFVGDGAYRELQGAEAVGMTAVLIRVPHDEWEREGTIGWQGPRVAALAELLALV